MKNYKFDGSISLEVMNNYLDRTLTHMMFGDGDVSRPFETRLASGIRMIKKTGAKYIQRALCPWPPTIQEEQRYPQMKAVMDELHEFDADIIFEACIFEIVGTSVNNIPIPAFVFEAFGLQPEQRNFNLDAMLFDYDLYRNQWGSGAHVPDITKKEAQMFFYYRACRLIDTGFEALHLGQTGLIGKFDVANRWWSEVIYLIRDYAAKHARRHYVVLNSHWSMHNFVGTDGRTLQDFNAYPCRVFACADETDHEVSEENPQRCDLIPGRLCAPYGMNKCGVTPSGQYVEHYPYLLEYDNWGGKTGDTTRAVNQWGYDEISWYANQPKWYRHEFHKNAVAQIKAYCDNGHFAAAGCRCAYVNGKMDTYYADMKVDNPLGLDDEDFIRDFWASEE